MKTFLETVTVHGRQHGNEEIPELVFVKSSDCWYEIEKGWYMG